MNLRENVFKAPNYFVFELKFSSLLGGQRLFWLHFHFCSDIQYRLDPGTLHNLAVPSLPPEPHTIGCLGLQTFTDDLFATSVPLLLLCMPQPLLWSSFSGIPRWT